jgi:hypothetical protein
MREITAWLTNPDDYETGLELLRSTGFSGFLLGVLAAGENAYNRSRLEAELRTCVAKQENLPVASAGTQPGPTRYAEESAVTVAMDFANPNSVVVVDRTSGGLRLPTEDEQRTVKNQAWADLQKQFYKLIDERKEHKAQLYAKLDDGNSDEQMAQRLPHAMRIKQITRQLDEIDSQLTFADEHGYLPPVAKDAAVDLDDTAQLMNVRTYVTRYTQKLNSKKKPPTPEQRQRWEPLLLQYSQEKKRLETKLGLNTHTDPVT